jgi:serine/threonine protein kinase
VPPPPPDPLHAAGAVIAERYRVRELVAEGGFSFVYRGERTADGRPVALKFFREQRTGQRAALERAFVAESGLLGELSRRSPATVQSLDAGTWSHRGQAWLYTVLEWLDGETLARRLSRERAAGVGGWPIAQVVLVLEPIALALAVACDLGIAHRDIKPGNVFLVEEGGHPVAKLIDFGTAKVASGIGGFDVASSVIGVFTVAYAAPEQIQRELGPTGPWTDVYAFAILCIELLLGRPPFSRHDLAMMLRRVAGGGALVPRDFGLDVAPALDAVLARALTTQPRDRYPDVRAFWAALRAAVA